MRRVVSDLLLVDSFVTAVVVTFADSRAAVEESAGMVSLLLVATGAEVATAFTVQVDPSEAVPPSARGG